MYSYFPAMSEAKPQCKDEIGSILQNPNIPEACQIPICQRYYDL